MWIFFIALPGAILGLNLFLAWAAWKLFAPRKNLQIAAAGTAFAVLLIFATAFVGFLLRTYENPVFAFAWEFLAFALVPVVYLSLWAFAGTLIAKFFPKLSRFKFAFAGTGVAVVSVACFYGFWKFENPTVTHLAWTPKTGELLEISPEEAAKREPKLRIVATADWHLGSRIERVHTKNFVKLVNAQEPDVVVISGDLIDGRIDPVEAAALDEVLCEIDAPLGVFAVLGNHEYFGDLARELAFIRRAGIRLLRDEHILVNDGEGTKILFVGRDDAINRSRSPLAHLFEKLPASVTDDIAVFVLDHQPKGYREAVSSGANFVFSGHTHAGQLWPATWLVGLFNPHVHGAWREAGTCGYVTSGLGLWHIPYRIGSCSELVVIDVF